MNKDGDRQKPKLFGVPYHIEATSAEQSMQRPCLTFRNGHNPLWVDMARHPFEFGETSPRDARYYENRFLTGLSIAMLAVGDYWMSGWKWYMGVLIQQGMVLPVPVRAEDLITGPLSYYATWHGRVPAPYGFAIWSMNITSGTHIYVNAILEDD